MGLIDIPAEIANCDSIIEANQRGDAVALRAALESNIEAWTGIMANAGMIQRKYIPKFYTALDALHALDKLNAIGTLS